MDNVDLSCYLIHWSEPRFTDLDEPGIGVVLHKRLRVSFGVLLERVPDAAVMPFRGEMVAFRSLAFIVDDLVEDLVDLIYERWVWEEVSKDVDSGA